MTTPTPTLTLTEFLLARIREDEAAAWAAGGLLWLDGAHPTPSAVVADASGDVVVYREGVASEQQAAHIARWGPARTLVECEVKRRIIARGDEPTLRLLALPFADHAGYSADWRP